MILPTIQFLEDDNSTLKTTKLSLYFEDEIKIPEYKWICKSFQDELLNETNEFNMQDSDLVLDEDSYYENINEPHENTITQQQEPSNNTFNKNNCDDCIDPLNKQIWCKCKNIPMDQYYKCLTCLKEINDQFTSEYFFIPELYFAVDATCDLKIDLQDNILSLKNNILNGEIHCITIKNMNILLYFQNNPLELNYSNEFILNKQHNQPSMYIDNIKNKYELKKDDSDQVFEIETDFDLSLDFYHNEENNKCIQLVFEGSLLVNDGKNKFRFQLCKSIENHIEDLYVSEKKLENIKDDYQTTSVDDNTTLTSNF